MKQATPFGFVEFHAVFLLVALNDNSLVADIIFPGVGMLRVSLHLGTPFQRYCKKMDIYLNHLIAVALGKDSAMPDCIGYGKVTLSTYHL